MRSFPQNLHGAWRAAVSSTLFVTALLLTTTAGARTIEDLRFSRIGNESTIEIALVCSMAVTGQQSFGAGTEHRIALTVGQDCRLLIRDAANELYRPNSGRLAHLGEVEFDRESPESATLILRFDKSVAITLRQTANASLVTLIVNTHAVVPEDLPIPPPNEPAARALPSMPTGDNQRFSNRVLHDKPAVRDRFAIRVAVISDSDAINYAALQKYTDSLFYANEILVGERRWAELRMGFFDTEVEAEDALAELADDFSSAWITVANSEEQARAQSRPFVFPGPEIVASVNRTRAEAILSTDELVTMMADARHALLQQDYAESARLYRHLLLEPAGNHREKAREFLGVAYEKQGLTVAARVEYSAFLEEFPDSTGVRRVQQRLVALESPKVLAVSSPASSGDKSGDIEAPSDTAARWEIYGGASQYYLRGVNIAGADDADFVAQSALLSQGYGYLRRRGERFDLVARANVTYLYDFEDESGAEQALVSTAYVDVTDTKYDINARIGRQRQPSGGVLGRFDGIHASYRLRPNLMLNVSAGYPVDSPRFLATPDHRFYGASIDLNNIAGAWDFSLFTNQQTVDGISDRKAVGVESQYHSKKLNLVGLLDYDASYNIINTALASANWRIHNRVTLYGRLRGGVAPFLTTRNALIGQPVNTVRELFGTFSEGQIRRLARNRTADERSGSTGLSIALTPRLQLKADMSYLEYSATVASGGVTGLPETGPRYSYGGHLQGSGLFKAGNVTRIGYRHDESRSIDSDTYWLDVRYPISERLRLQTRLSASQRIANQNVVGDITQWVANPVLRLMYVGERRYRFELEVGGQWSNREFPPELAPPLLTDGELEQSDYYLQLGYQLDF